MSYRGLLIITLALLFCSVGPGLAFKPSGLDGAQVVNDDIDLGADQRFHVKMASPGDH
ncbi:MAG: hypothetical protein ABIL58_17090 [Pseudomonadota bacterium]